MKVLDMSALPTWRSRWPGVLTALWLVFGTAAHAQPVRFERVAEGVYAHIGLGGRTVANQGLNANIGLVLTPGGAVLIDSGARARSAQRIHEAVRQVTALPVKWGINTGGQDHRWLGNGYFKAQGAQLIAHAHGVKAFDTRPWKRLLNEADLMPGNASRTYLELELE
jgi:glyoxylase-like metal-dependent hydrolase (beta-lactamase superfamily II)